MPRRDTLLRKALVLRTDDLGRKVVSGASYQFAGIVIRTVLTIGSTAILARLLSPADFGYIAMATVITEFAALFSNFGFNALLIQRRVITRWQVDTVFWASLALGCLLAVSVFLASFFAGLLFTDPRVGALLKVMCITFVLNALHTIPSVVLLRLMRFRTEFFINVASVIIRISAAIACAHAGLGVWSLVAGSIVGAAVTAGLGFAFVPLRPRLRARLSFLAGTWRTSMSYFGSGLLFFINTNVDLLLIGRRLGATTLGYYQNSRSLTDEIRSRIAVPLQHVLFPAFSAVQEDLGRMQRVFRQSARMIAAAVFPVGAAISALANDLVIALMGPKWLPMIPVVGVLGLSAALKASTAVANPVFNAVDRAGLAFRFNLIATALVVVAVVSTLPFGLLAVASAVASVSLYTLIPFARALRLIGLGTAAFWEILGPPFLASAVAWLLTTSIQTLSWWPSSSVLLSLLAGAAIFALCYTSVLHLLTPVYLADLRDIRHRFRGSW